MDRITLQNFLFDKHRTLSQGIMLATGTFVLCAVILPSSVHVVIALWTFLCGVLICYYTLSPLKVVPNLYTSQGRDKMVCQPHDELTLLKKICPVCGKENCNRHRPELNILAFQPWTNLEVPKKLDDAFEEFLNLVLKEFVYTWYKEVSCDEAFVAELRSSLRFIASVLFRRLLKVDIPSLVIQKVTRVAVRHLHYYLEVRRKEPTDLDLEQAVLDLYGKDLHSALRNRQTELDYLRALSERAFPHILPLRSLKCRSLCVLLREILSGVILLPSLDVLADPDIVNNILILLLEKSSPNEVTDLPSQKVTFLANFCGGSFKNNSCLHIELADILGSPDALFPFMQFMKAEASVNVLQFYLSVEELNSKLLQPELSETQLSQLHDELCYLYNNYCDPAAVDRIQFDDDIINQLQEIVNGAVDGIVKLQTTTPLFRAHEHAYSLLENTFLPLFHQSDDYYQMLCGERLPTRLQKSSSSNSLTSKNNSSIPVTNRNARKPGDAMTLSKIGSKIKMVFKANTVLQAQASRDRLLNPCYENVDGRLPDDVDYSAEEGDASPQGSMNNLSENDLLPTYTRIDRLEDGPLHDLSAWRVTIPSLVVKPDPENSRKYFYYYVVEVRRVDVLEDDFEASNWRVERRYPEFYVLEQKLTEFHGEFDDSMLPPKKAFGTKSKDFLDSKRQAFEQYLQGLLTKPTLKGSELLYTFLTAQYEFATNFLDINLGKMMKSGALKLVKERGQHLDPFLQSFLLSTESAKPRPCRWSDRDSDTLSISSEKMSSQLYENNANVELNFTPVTPKHSKFIEAEVSVAGLYDTVLYVVEKAFEAPMWLLSILLSVRIVLRATIDTFLDWFLAYKLNRTLTEHRLAHIVHLLRDAVFFDNDPPRSDEEKMIRRERALKELRNFIPTVFVKAVGNCKHKEATQLVFDALQKPKLNKQLSYMLLDIVIEEVFPELVSQQNEFDMYSGCFKVNSSAS